MVGSSCLANALDEEGLRCPICDVDIQARIEFIMPPQAKNLLDVRFNGMENMEDPFLETQQNPPEPVLRQDTARSDDSSMTVKGDSHKTNQRPGSPSIRQSSPPHPQCKEYSIEYVHAALRILRIGGVIDIDIDQLRAGLALMDLRREASHVYTPGQMIGALESMYNLRLVSGSG